MQDGWHGVECDRQGGHVETIYLPMERDISGEYATNPPRPAFRNGRSMWAAATAGLRELCTCSSGMALRLLVVAGDISSLGGLQHVGQFYIQMKILQ